MTFKRSLTFISMLSLLLFACSLFGGQEQDEEGPSQESLIQTAIAQTEAARPTETVTDTLEPTLTDTPAPTDTLIPTDTPDPTETPSAAAGGGTSATATVVAAEDCSSDDVAAWTAASAAVIAEMRADAALVSANPALLTDPIQGPLLALRALARQNTVAALTAPGCLQDAQSELATAVGQNNSAFELAAGGDVASTAADIAASTSALTQVEAAISQVTGGG